MGNQLTNKIAVVTGASRGIGRATALRLAREGAKVYVHYNGSAEAAAAVVEEIAAAGGAAVAVQADLSTAAGPAKLAGAVEGEIDILVNNAGVVEYAGLAETTPEQFDRLFTVNVKSLFFLTQALEPRIRPGGRVIHVSSILSHRAFPGLTAYAATKGAVDALTIHLAAQLGAREITVNAVAPGAIDTDASAWLQTEQGQATAKQMQAIPRVGKAEDVADAVAALAGPDGRWITGQVIAVSGGAKL
ncbi:MAG: SDR family oxidoreductase [Acidobacteriaceae bacterium]|nr:SDR family oxidoreductase [Acidobacteriaceae bacterium]